MAQEEVNQKRLFERSKFNGAVQFQYKGRPYYGGTIANDLSEDGIRINLHDFVPLNTELNLQVQQEAQKFIECIGRVVWIEQLAYSERFRAGLQFTGSFLNAGPKNEIRQYLSSIKGK